MRGKLSGQEYSAVLWVRSVNAMIDGVATRIVECGPGKVLAGFARCISKGTPVATINTVDGLQKRLRS